MKALHRNLESILLQDLKKKFVFLSGPRQVGKTTLAKKIIHQNKGIYLLYDDEKDRENILKKQYIHQHWVCLDEFHKFPRWKSHLKGVFDKYHESLHLLLTGSARLDVFQKSGDSLSGRYYLHHLHPLSLGELHFSEFPSFLTSPLENSNSLPHLLDLLKLGGFPEPFYSGSQKEHRRWSNQRRQLIIKEELREIAQIDLIRLIEQLMMLLPHRVGSQFSYRSLAEDIRVSVPTIQNWMHLFERLFVVFKIFPYSKNIIRSIQRQPKYFFYDWSQIVEEGIRFENLVASHLYKAVQIWTDLGEANLNLYYIRDRDRREVDFLVTREEKPWFLVEAKLSDTVLTENLKYFSKRLNVPGIQLVLKPNVFSLEGNLVVMSADQWLGRFP